MISKSQEETEVSERLEEKALEAEMRRLGYPSHGCIPAEPASVSPGKFILAPLFSTSSLLVRLPNRETCHHVGSCCKPAFILEVWVARTVVVVAAGGLRAGRHRSSEGTRSSDRSDPSDERRR